GGARQQGDALLLFRRQAAFASRSAGKSFSAAAQRRVPTAAQADFSARTAARIHPRLFRLSRLASELSAPGAPRSDGVDEGIRLDRAPVPAAISQSIGAHTGRGDRR